MALHVAALGMSNDFLPGIIWVPGGVREVGRDRITCLPTLPTCNTRHLGRLSPGSSGCFQRAILGPIIPNQTLHSSRTLSSLVTLQLGPLHVHAAPRSAGPSLFISTGRRSYIYILVLSRPIPCVLALLGPRFPMPNLRLPASPFLSSSLFFCAWASVPGPPRFGLFLFISCHTMLFPRGRLNDSDSRACG